MTKLINNGPILDHSLKSKKALEYLDFFHHRVIGQERAIKMLVTMKLRHDIGFIDENSPAGIVALFGPSGVGKTYLAKIFAELCFGDKMALTFVEGEDYLEEHSVSRLIGSPPGYIGFHDRNDERYPGTPPMLSQEVLYRNTVMGIKRGLRSAEKDMAAIEKIRSLGNSSSDHELRESLLMKVSRLRELLQKFKVIEDVADVPSIVLLDEIEKMHPNVRNAALLTPLNEGVLVLPSNVTTSFRNTFFIIAGNIAEEKIRKIGSGTLTGFVGGAVVNSKRERNRDIWKALRPELLKTFGSPLLGRIGEKRVVSCDLLGGDEKLKIFDIALRELRRKLDLYERPCRLEVTNEVKAYLVNDANQVLGARSLGSLIEAWIESPLIALLTNDEAEGGIVAGDVLRAILADKAGATDGTKEIKFELVSRRGSSLRVC